jgi:hypothetical protein
MWIRIEETKIRKKKRIKDTIGFLAGFLAVFIVLWLKKDLFDKFSRIASISPIHFIVIILFLIMFAIGIGKLSVKLLWSYKSNAYACLNCSETFEKLTDNCPHCDSQDIEDLNYLEWQSND